MTILNGPVSHILITATLNVPGNFPQQTPQSVVGTPASNRVSWVQIKNSKPDLVVFFTLSR